MGKGLQEILSQYANELVGEMKTNLLASMRMRASEVGGIQPHASTLQQMMTIELRTDAVFIRMPFYAIFIEEGVKGAKSTYDESKDSSYRFKDKMPPTRVFSGAGGWIARRGLIDRRTIRERTGKKGKDLKDAVVKENKRLAFAIAKSIREKGIKGYHFIDKAMRSDMLDKLVSTLAEQTEKEIVTRITI